MKNLRYIVLSLLLSLPLFTWAVDASYYSSLNNKKDSELRSALTVLLYNHHIYYDKYDGASSGTENWDFPFDYDPNTGYVWDIYTTGCDMPADIGSTASCCCTGLNREHLVCQSTFGGSDNEDKVPQYADRHSLFLTDAYTNQRRNDQAFGEVDKTKPTSKGGCATCEEKAMGMLGKVGTFADLYDSSEDIYEVGDEYKGDVARAVLYMVVRYAERQYCRLPDGAKYYNSKTGVGNVVRSELTTASAHEVTTWKNKGNSTAATIGQMFSTDLSTNYGLSAYGKAILLKWHRQDPVSQKEIDRNAGVETVQGNRNPFIDYPCLVEYIWGDKTGQNFSTANAVGSFESTFVKGVSDGCSCGTDPAITLPVGTIAFGTTNTANPLSQTITVRGVNLTAGNLTLTIGGTNAAMFSFSSSASVLTNNSITKAQAEAGQTITIYYKPTAVNDHTATLTISGCGVTSHTVTLTGTCETRHTITWMDKGTSYHTNTVADGGSPSVPGAPDDCSTDRVFRGWTAQSAYNNSTTAPADLFTTTAPVANGDITFYAVYATKTTSGSSSNYELYTGTLIEGDYVIYYNGKAMKATVSSNRFGYQSVTPVNNTISSPSAGIVWHIAPQEDYWTLYNDSANNYAASTGEANKVQLFASGTDDKALWTANKGEGTYDFVNKQNTTNGVNNYLRNNNTYGFSCYSSGTGGQLSLYKVAANVTYSQYSLSCSSANTVTVTFHGNGATGGSTPHQSVPANVSTALSANGFTYECHTFAGWATSAGGTKVYNDQQAITISSNLDLYAVWTANPTYTADFKNNGANFATRSGCTGQAMTALDSDPSVCAGNTFEGWSTSTYALTNTTAPSLVTPTVIPEGNTTYHAVYTYSTTTSGGAAGAEAGTTMWEETWQGSTTSGGTADNYTPSANYGHGTTVYNSGTVTYTQSANTVYVRNNSNAGGTAPELMITAGQTWTISNIPVANAAELSLTYLSNNTNSSVTCSTAGASISGSSKSYTITPNGAETITLVFASPDGNTRIDNISLTVKTQGTGSVTTVYHTTSPDCETCTPVTPNPSFASATKETTVGGTVTNALNKDNSDGAVTYSSSNAAVATVNASTGEITALAAGTTRITASIAASACYNAASAYYDLTVTIPIYTVTWHVNGATTPVVYTSGETLNLPSTPADCSATRVFKGWTTNASYSGNGSDLITPSGTVTANADYYAVYADKHTTSGGSSTKTYTFSITATDFSGTYGSGSKTSTATASDESTMTVTWNYNQVRKYSGMQWQASNGYIYNSTDLGTIQSVTITSDQGTFTTYYGTSEQPSTSTTEGGGYFKIVVGNATGKTSEVAVTFQKTEGAPDVTTYDNYGVLCSDCSVTITAVSEDDEKGTVDITVIP